MKRTANELSERTGVSARTIQKKAKALGIMKDKGKYLFTDDEAERIANELSERTSERTNEPEGITVDLSDDLEAETITETFTADEYEKLQEVIQDYKAKVNEAKHLLEQTKIYQNQLEYMKQSLAKKDEQISKLIDTFESTIRINSERNHLEYLDKHRQKE